MDKFAASVPQHSLRAWIGAGLALDGVSICVFWFVIYSLPLDLTADDATQASGLYDVMAIALIPWLVHVLALPALFKAPLPRFAPLKTIVYGTIAPLAAVVLGFGVFPIIFIGIFAVLENALHPFLATSPTHEPTFLRSALVLGILLVPSTTGAALGLLTTALRQTPKMIPQPVRRRSDVIGGALGGFSGFAVLFAAGSLFGPFSVYDPVLNFHPRFIFALVGGLLALLPHLILTGRDTLRVINPHPATSACDAAQSAPSR